jgi:hypothetical protein
MNLHKDRRECGLRVEIELASGEKKKWGRFKMLNVAGSNFELMQINFRATFEKKIARLR